MNKISSKTNVCHQCNITKEELSHTDQKLRRCGGCNIIFYCSVSCQKKDWPKHKEVCCHSTQKKILPKKKNEYKEVVDPQLFGELLSIS